MAYGERPEAGQIAKNEAELVGVVFGLGKW